MTVAELRALLDNFNDDDKVYINADRGTPDPCWLDKRHETMFMIRTLGGTTFMTEEEFMSDEEIIASGGAEVLEQGLLLWPV